jgi:hypothetical protein
LRFLDFYFDVRRGRAVAGQPLAFGVRIDLAVPAGFKFENFIAFSAFINDRLTAVPEKTAALFGHEGAFHSLFDCFAKHVAQTPLPEFSVMLNAAESGGRTGLENRRVLNSKKTGCQEKIRKIETCGSPD